MCGTFSSIFEDYEPEIRCRMLSPSTPMNGNNKEMTWQWDDWDI